MDGRYQSDVVVVHGGGYFCRGGVIGSLSAGAIADKFGRKRALLLNNVLAVLAAILMGFSKLANSYEMLIIGRLVIGVNCGINTGIVPMYLSEISPVNLRGGIGVLHQLAVTSGILISQILGLPVVLGTSELWPVLLGLTVAPTVFQLCTLPFCKESPRYLLISQKKEFEAKKALVWLCKDDDVSDMIQEMQSEYEEENKEERMSIAKLLKDSSLRMPLIISVVLQLSQQLSGINAVLYYSTSIFIEAGVDEDKSPYVTLSTGAIMVIMTVVSIPLMDRLGRKTLHMFGLGFMLFWAIFLTVFLSIAWSGAAYGSIICVMLFTVGFAIGPGSIPWLIVSELFSQGPRPAAVSVAFMVNWGANFLVGLLFPFMLDGLNEYVFVVFIVLLAVFFLFTWKFLPETKNKSFEEISALFKKNKAHHYEVGGANMDLKKI
ncbi:putative solute carrier family 2, facilitated glucose transporter member 1 [Apostichopus japonicus]|uniref:Putative solute carrier family 2, facilitated glucose transporter member 1 n=1 Tax=Stichopus japonicus TaxID=307972 RepID=A0A2G8LLC1_STIJA|nr:putative solute carrier family 2, facilitated glucose transporter member 1 [Apostichopus japonicus]